MAIGIPPPSLDAGHGPMSCSWLGVTPMAPPICEVLAEVSLHCAAGKTTALVGFSGSGEEREGGGPRLWHG